MKREEEHGGVPLLFILLFILLICKIVEKLLN